MERASQQTPMRGILRHLKKNVRSAHLIVQRLFETVKVNEILSHNMQC